MAVRVATDEAGIVNNREIPDICLQHLIAVMLVDKTVSFKSAHEKARMTDAAVLRERAKVQLIPDAELEKLMPRREAIVEVTLNDGKRLSERVGTVRGTAKNPMTRAEVIAKARDLITPVVGAAKSRQAHREGDGYREFDQHPGASATAATGRYREIAGFNILIGLSHRTMKRVLPMVILAAGTFPHSNSLFSRSDRRPDGRWIQNRRGLSGRFGPRHGRPIPADSRSGFTSDLLQIQSVPQAFIWVTTYPTSNMGEPHTQEHLLLGKGNKGRALGSQEPMSLVSSSAFTEQWMTCYHFYASAGAEVFYDHFEHTMDALLHPDYSQEEVRREVRNFGVSADPKTGSLRLEEKGTVYNEMVTSMDQAPNRLFRAAGLAAYGPEHPLAYNSGGSPEALRVIKPSDIERFHAQHYFLGNMGAIASLPKDMTLALALAHFDATLNRLEPEPKRDLPVTTEDQLPAPRPAVPAASSTSSMRLATNSSRGW